jgi:YYY domain-containing protein
VDWNEALLLATMGLVVGAMRPINTWDYPTYLLVVGVALAIREYERRGRVDVSGILAAAWRSGAVLVLSYAFFLPFISRFATAYVSLERWKGPRTGLDRYLIIHGLFLWAIVSLMGVVLFHRGSRQAVARMVRIVACYWDRIPRVLTLYRNLVRDGRQWDSPGMALVGLLALFLAWLVKSGEWFYIFLLLLILGTLAIVVRRRMEPKWRLLWLLFGIGLALSLGVDLFVLKGDIGRMNTVFKFYLQIWVLWSVVAVVSLSDLAEHTIRWSVRRQRLWWGVFTVLFCLAALYPPLATKAKISDRFDVALGPGLDGMAYMTEAVYHDEGPLELKWDYAAINWLLDNVQGSPVIAEGNTERRGLYRWGSRVSIYTGLPTIIGWGWHQRQQRSAMPGEWIERRINDVERLYSDPDPEVGLRILRKYDVEYVYLGELERSYYPGSGLDKFEELRERGVLAVSYESERVKIYKVLG